MKSDPPSPLSQRLAQLFEQGFFRPLARPSAQLYVDCADRLELASDEGGQLSHADAIALVRDALAAHPGVKLDEDEGGQFADLRQRAGQIFNRLLEARWLEERPSSLDERWVVLSPRLPPLLGLLRGFAEDDLAELKDFAATVRSVCETLLTEGSLDPARRESEEMRQVVKELLDRVTRAGQQMRAVETVILRYVQEQRVSASPNETLRRFLIDIHEGEHMVCYDTLERGGLLPKLKQARLVAQDALANPFAKQRLAEPHYIRRSGVTLIGLEFTWPTERNKPPRRETWGVRVQYTSPTSKAEQTYFYVPARLNWAEIAPSGEVMSEEEFKSFVRREYEMVSGRKCLFPRQKDYLAEMATPHHLWFDEKQFPKTFPKAIAFEAEKDVENFIRRFILEENPLEVKDVKSAVGAYRETQARLERQTEEAELLRNVRELHGTYEKAKREAAILQHFGHALDHARLGELVTRHEKDLADLRTKHAQDNEAFDKFVTEAGRLKTALGEFHLDSDEAELKQKLTEQQTKRAEQTGLLQAQQGVRQRLRDLRLRWTQWLKRGAAIKLEGMGEILTVDDRLLDAMAAPDEKTGLAAMPDLAERFSQLFQAVGKLLEPHTTRITSISNRLKEIVADLERLDDGQTPGSFPIFQAIKTRLANSSTPPEQLCRLIEVKPNAEDWRNAVELVLGRNRFATSSWVQAKITAPH